MRVFRSLTVAALMLAGPLAAQRIRVSETAGIRRFGYPVTATLPASLAGRGVRLLESGKPVAAQARGDQLDFSVSLGPYEQRDFTVEPGAPEGSEQRAVVREEGGQYAVGYTPSLQFFVPSTLLGFLQSVKTAKWDYLRPGSQGLVLRYRDDIYYRAGGFGPYGKPTEAYVIKQGPLSTVLEFRSTEALRGTRSVESRVRMEFPRSKSWVKTTWTVEDPEALIIGLGADVNLNLEAEPVLADFGAGTWVYAALRPGARGGAANPASATLIAEPQSWRVLVGGEPYVAGKSGRAEGWAHVMDRERCTAVAVADFGTRRDRMEVAADGRLQIWREYRGSGPKTLTFWLHFVGMPVQVGAATSAQAMLAPLKVEFVGF